MIANEGGFLSQRAVQIILVRSIFIVLGIFLWTSAPVRAEEAPRGESAFTLSEVFASRFDKPWMLAVNLGRVRDGAFAVSVHRQVAEAWAGRLALKRGFPRIQQTLRSEIRFNGQTYADEIKYQSSADGVSLASVYSPNGPREGGWQILFEASLFRGQQERSETSSNGSTVTQKKDWNGNALGAQIGYRWTYHRNYAIEWNIGTEVSAAYKQSLFGQVRDDLGLRMDSELNLATFF